MEGLSKQLLAHSVRREVKRLLELEHHSNGTIMDKSNSECFYSRAANYFTLNCAIIDPWNGNCYKCGTMFFLHLFNWRQLLSREYVLL